MLEIKELASHETKNELLLEQKKTYQGERYGNKSMICEAIGRNSKGKTGSWKTTPQVFCNIQFLALITGHCLVVGVRLAVPSSFLSREP
jgi:hypothetical protein